MDAGVIMSFKRHYRRSHVRLLLRYVEVDNRAEDLRMDILQAIRFIIQAWDLRNVSEDICQNENLVLNELTDALRDLNLPYPMQAEEFLNLPEDNIVYKVPEDDKIIEEYLFKNTERRISRRNRR
ncbi:CENP-B homolog protein 2-like [Rhizophagus irregularis DAOM 181602=DAOM 197198]|nr:CENP-B homolog protein 2-like [Rhizophagus irregularis DAOM 181602=DAOM 197198]